MAVVEEINQQLVDDLHALLKMCIVFLVGSAENGDRVTVERRQDNLWVVKRSGFVQNRDGEWEFEGLPTNRTDSFLRNTRFDFRDAMLRASEAVTPRDAQVDPARRPEAAHA